MSITIKFNADATGVHSALAGVTGQIDGLKEEMSGLSWADFAMGAEAVIGLLVRAAGAARGLFEAVIAPAAEMEQYMVRFETVLGSAAHGLRQQHPLRAVGARGRRLHPAVLRHLGGEIRRRPQAAG